MFFLKKLVISTIRPGDARAEQGLVVWPVLDSVLIVM
jgi:hypothetical protein